ncbi:hypothetical protein NY40_1654 [Helicobacter pylori NY40]|uniref:Uncharacterized protein n=1 Tax=Helicobacter pylori NY40 TaxID=1426844 RepID=A0A060PWG3_HELPX|nr:hypothetical protein NY40_1654 [Helicobacter pylori NY40]
MINFFNGIFNNNSAAENHYNYRAGGIRGAFKTPKRHAKLAQSSAKQRAIHRSIRRTNQRFKGDLMINFFNGIFNNNSAAENHYNYRAGGIRGTLRFDRLYFKRQNKQ